MITQNKISELQTQLNQHNINTKNLLGNTLLHTAMLCFNLEAIKVLIQHNANVSQQDRNGQTILDIFLHRMELSILESDTVEDLLSSEVLIWLLTNQQVV